MCTQCTRIKLYRCTRISNTGIYHTCTWRYFSRPCFLSSRNAGSGSTLVNGSLDTRLETLPRSGSSKPAQCLHVYHIEVSKWKQVESKTWVKVHFTVLGKACILILVYSMLHYKRKVKATMQRDNCLSRYLWHVEHSWRIWAAYCAGTEIRCTSSYPPGVCHSRILSGHSVHLCWAFVWETARDKFQFAYTNMYGQQLQTVHKQS